MKNSKPNEIKANKKTLDKILWFLLLSWLLLLLLIALISMYQKEGIIHQDDLGNTLFSKVSTFNLFFIVGAPIFWYFFGFLLTIFFEKIRKREVTSLGYIVALPLTILICGYIGYFTPYWTSLKFDNDAKVLTLTERSFSNGKQKVMIPYSDSRFTTEYSLGYGDNKTIYQIYLEIPKEASKLFSESIYSNRYEERWEIYYTSFFRFWGEREHRNKTLDLFSSLINDNSN